MKIKHFVLGVIAVLSLASCGGQSSEKADYIDGLNPIIESHTKSFDTWNKFVFSFEEIDFDAMESDESMGFFEEADSRSYELSSTATKNAQKLAVLQVPKDCRDGQLLFLDAVQTVARGADLIGFWSTKIASEFEFALSTGEYDPDSFLEFAEIEEGDRLMAEANLLLQRANFEFEDCAR